MKSLTIEAMPRNIGPISRSNPYVQYIREKTQSAFDAKSHKVSQSPDIPGLWYLSSSRNSGIFFTMLAGKVNFVYSYEPLTVNGGVHVAESLAFRWEEDFTSSGLLRPIFYDILLPKKKVVVTDAEYTSDGKKWWKSQYNEALRNPHKYGLLLVEGSEAKEISPENFHARQSDYWGDSDVFSKFRFGIFLRSSTLQFPLLP